MKKIDFAFQLLDHYDIITSCSNLESIKKWVWKESVYETGALNNEQIEYAANTGFIVSKKNIISLENIKNKLSPALKLKSHMELACIEQSFLNYLIITSNKQYSSLYALLDTPLYPENYIEFWAGRKKGDLLKGMQAIEKEKLRYIFIIHWAGEWQKRKFEYKLFNFLKKLRIKRTIWTTSIIMPFKKLWKHYRFLDL
ncbi:hypothetical protein ACFL6I_11105 [candidate division KSB1 bacterium]